ncbi:MAG: hypothetical protein WC149_08685 [Arcobacteraceae bacterium]
MNEAEFKRYLHSKNVRETRAKKKQEKEKTENTEYKFEYLIAVKFVQHRNKIINMIYFSNDENLGKEEITRRLKTVIKTKFEVV